VFDFWQVGQVAIMGFLSGLAPSPPSRMKWSRRLLQILDPVVDGAPSKRDASDLAKLCCGSVDGLPTLSGGADELGEGGVPSFELPINQCAEGGGLRHWYAGYTQVCKRSRTNSRRVKPLDKLHR
jgi:hypothetical protein